MIGSTVITRPSVSQPRAVGSGQFGIIGSSWIVRPMPWPCSAGTIEKPDLCTSSSIARPTSNARRPGRTSRSARWNAFSAQVINRCARAEIVPTPTVIAASAM